MTLWKMWCAGLVLMVSATAAVAQPELLDEIRTQQAEIRQGLQAGSGPYAKLSYSERNTLLQKQAAMLRGLEGKTHVNELSPAARSELFNTLELMEAVVNRADDERMVCERKPILGSTRKQHVCMTVAQRREAQEQARNQMDIGKIDR